MSDDVVIESTVAVPNPGPDAVYQYAETGWYEDGTIYVHMVAARDPLRRLSRSEAARLMAALGWALHGSEE